MNIEIMGSWKKEDQTNWVLKDKGNFLKACRELGEEIAHKGDNLFITSDGSLIN